MDEETEVSFGEEEEGRAEGEGAEGEEEETYGYASSEEEEASDVEEARSEKALSEADEPIALGALAAAVVAEQQEEPVPFDPAWRRQGAEKPEEGEIVTIPLKPRLVHLKRPPRWLLKKLSLKQLKRKALELEVPMGELRTKKDYVNAITSHIRDLERLARGVMGTVMDVSEVDKLEPETLFEIAKGLNLRIRAYADVHEGLENVREAVKNHLIRLKDLIEALQKEVTTETGVEIVEEERRIPTTYGRPIKVTRLVPQAYVMDVREDVALEYGRVIKARKKGKYLVPVGAERKTQLVGGTGSPPKRTYLPAAEPGPSPKRIQFPKRPKVEPYELYSLPVELDMRKYFVEAVQDAFVRFFAPSREVPEEQAIVEHRPAKVSWENYYSREFEKWTYARLHRDLVKWAETNMEHIQTEARRRLDALTQPDAIMASFLDRHGAGILDGTNRTIIDVLERSKAMTTLDAVILVNMKRRANLHPEIKGADLAVELSDIINEHLLASPVDPKRVYDEVYDEYVMRAFRAYRPTAEARATFEGENLDKLRALYEEYEKGYGARASPKKPEKLPKMTKEKIATQVRAYEQKIHALYGVTVKSYLERGLLPLIFLRGETSPYTLFLQSKLRSEDFDVAALYAASLAHFFPELVMNEKDYSKAIERLEYLLLDAMNEFLYGYVERSDPTARVKRRPLVVEEKHPFAWKKYVVDIRKTCKGDVSKTEDKDLVICLTEGEFSCHSIPDLVRQFSKRDYENHILNKPFPDTFVKRIEARHGRR